MDNKDLEGDRHCRKMVDEAINLEEEMMEKEKETTLQPLESMKAGESRIEIEAKVEYEAEKERAKKEREAEVRKDQDSYQIKYQFKLPLVYYREKGLAKVEQVVPALVLKVVDDDEPYRRTLQIFTEQGDHIVRNVVFDKEKVGCWFPIALV